MKLTDWFKRKEEVTKKVTEPPTRTTVLFGLFCNWGDKPFSYEGLVGINGLALAGSVLIWWYEGHIDIQHDNEVILRVEPGTFRSPHKATIYDMSYSDRLDGYIEALRLAIKDRDDATAAKRIKEETQF